MTSVSVVIPTYNGSRWVGETIRSALQQTLAPVEVIVVDDESTDDTPDIVRAFPEVRCIRIPNGGTGRARNEGVLAAKGDWIAFCDHDDLWRPTYLEAFAAELAPGSRYGFANWGDVQEDRWTDWDRFASIDPDFFADLGEPLYRKLIPSNPVRPSALLIRKDFFHDIGEFNPKFSRYASEDTEFTLRCNEHPHAVVLHAPLVGIRTHQSNYSKGRIRTLLSDAAILDWSAENHRLGRAHHAEMVAGAAALRVRALDEAFLEGDMARVREIARLVPGQYQATKTRMKVAMAQSRVVPGAVLRKLIGRPAGQNQVGVYAAAPATPE